MQRRILMTAIRGIGHTFEVYAGGDHSNKIRERLETRVLRFFSEVLNFQPPSLSSGAAARR